MARRIGRKLACGAALIGGVAFGAVATASPASAPEAASVRAQAASGAAVVDLASPDAAVDAARVARATTTTTTAPAEPTTTTAAPEPTTTTTIRARAAATPAPAPAPPEPAPAPAPTSSAERAIARWFPDVYDAAVSVARCESDMDPGAVSSGGGNHGLFQINSVHRSSFESVTGRPWSDVYFADANAQFARYLYDGSGWGPWTCTP